jgi:urease accessory protein
MSAAAQSAQAPAKKAAARPRLEAELRLEFRQDAASGRTILDASYQDPPLRVVRAFENADGAALAHLHNVSGGLLGGDQLAMTVRAGPAAHVQLTTTGATRIYRPRADAPVTTQTNEITVGENALLEYVPDPIIPFAASRFFQRTRIHLAEGAGLFWWEILAPGREARGETFEYHTLEMRTDIAAQSHPIAAESIRLEPHVRPLASLARLGPFRTWATFYICRLGLQPNVWLALEGELREIAGDLPHSGEVRWGISTLVAHGLAIRAIAERGRDVLPGLQSLWQAAKRRLFAREAIPPRKLY